MLGPDGLCVICRREQGARRGGSFSVGLLLLALVILVPVGALVALVLLQGEPPPEPEEPVAALERPRPAESLAAQGRAVESRSTPSAPSPSAQLRAIERAREQVQITLYMAPW